ncbi:MAG: hypothetical protein XD51_0147 [Moorella sp. 60_41]|nr:MAG: hypothetical protein XD51_0147 [Moorella sp. 60_41]
MYQCIRHDFGCQYVSEQINKYLYRLPLRAPAGAGYECRDECGDARKKETNGTLGGINMRNKCGGLREGGGRRTGTTGTAGVSGALYGDAGSEEIQVFFLYGPAVDGFYGEAVYVQLRCVVPDEFLQAAGVYPVGLVVDE